MSRLTESVESQWYTRPRWLILLAPLSFLFIFLSYLRRLRYGRSPSPSLPAPVIVVGNITVGGTGKTPVIIALVKHLYANGYQPGVIARGYGGNNRRSMLVTPGSDPSIVGDEPLFISQSIGCPVVVGADRVESANYLIENAPCDIILSDDGLQHYSLVRDVEIAVVDSTRRLGNGWRLPVGPLRESRHRLKEVDFVIINGKGFSASWLPKGKTFYSQIKPKAWRNVKTGEKVSLTELSLQGAYAIAGIGNPKRFFSTLKSIGFQGRCKAFADHHPFKESDMAFVGSSMLLMTEKDAVKCKTFAKNNWWALSIELDIESPFIDCLEAKIKR